MSDSFWSSNIGLTIRWVAFIPAGLLMTAIAEVVVWLVYAYIASLSMKWMIIILLLFGTVAIMVLYAQILAGALTGSIIPHRMTGNIIMTIILAAMHLFSSMGYVAPEAEEAIPAAVYGVGKLAMFGLFLWGLWTAKSS